MSELQFRVPRTSLKQCQSPSSGEPHCRRLQFGVPEFICKSDTLTAVVLRTQALSGIFLGIGGGTAANRQYFIQAEQVYWDYAPQGQYMCDEEPRPFNLREVRSRVRGPSRHSFYTS